MVNVTRRNFVRLMLTGLGSMMVPQIVTARSPFPVAPQPNSGTEVLNDWLGQVNGFSHAHPTQKGEERRYHVTSPVLNMQDKDRQIYALYNIFEYDRYPYVFKTIYQNGRVVRENWGLKAKRVIKDANKGNATNDVTTKKVFVRLTTRSPYNYTHGSSFLFFEPSFFPDYRKVGDLPYNDLFPLYHEFGEVNNRSLLKDPEVQEKIRQKSGKLDINQENTKFLWANLASDIFAFVLIKNDYSLDAKHLFLQRMQERLCNGPFLNKKYMLLGPILYRYQTDILSFADSLHSSLYPTPEKLYEHIFHRVFDWMVPSELNAWNKSMESIKARIDNPSPISFKEALEQEKKQGGQKSQNIAQWMEETLENLSIDGLGTLSTEEKKKKIVESLLTRLGSYRLDPTLYKRALTAHAYFAYQQKKEWEALGWKPVADNLLELSMEACVQLASFLTKEKELYFRWQAPVIFPDMRSKRDFIEFKKYFANTYKKDKSFDHDYALQVLENAELAAAKPYQKKILSFFTAKNPQPNPQNNMRGPNFGLQ